MKKKERKKNQRPEQQAIAELAAPRGLKSCRRNQPAMDNNIIVSRGRNDF